MPKRYKRREKRHKKTFIQRGLIENWHPLIRNMVTVQRNMVVIHTQLILNMGIAIAKCVTLGIVCIKYTKFPTDQILSKIIMYPDHYDANTN